MPQVFQVLRCYSCSTFQVHQVKKATKWNCKLCGEKQSIKKVYGRGTGADCRRHVQKLNMTRGDLEWASQTAESDDDVTVASSNKNCTHEGRPDSVLTDVSENTGSKWSAYTDDIVDTDEEPNTTCDMYTTSRVEFNQARKPRKRQRDDRSDKWLEVPECNRTMSNKVSGFADRGRSALHHKVPSFTGFHNARDVQGSPVNELTQSEERCKVTSEIPTGVGSRWNKHFKLTRNASNVLTDTESTMNKTSHSYEGVLPSGCYEPAATVKQKPTTFLSKPNQFSPNHVVSSKHIQPTHSVESQKRNSDLSTKSKTEEKTSQLGSKWSRFIEPEVTSDTFSDDDAEYGNVLFNNSESQDGTLRNLDDNIKAKQFVENTMTSLAFSVGCDDDLLRELDDF